MKLKNCCCVLGHVPVERWDPFGNDNDNTGFSLYHSIDASCIVKTHCITFLLVKK